MKIIPALLVLLTIYACGDSTPPVVKETKKPSFSSTPKVQEKKAKPVKEETTSRFRAVTLYDSKLGWGYDIFEGSKMVVHQPTIPAVQGMKGFKSEEDALKIADLVIRKLEQGMMPPTVSVEEMQELGVL